MLTCFHFPPYGYKENSVNFVCLKALSQESFHEVLHVYGETLLQKPFHQIHKLQTIKSQVTPLHIND